MSHLTKVACTTPDKLAAAFLPSGRTLTFKELDANANRAANALRALGVGPGDCVAFCVENSPELLALTFGAQRIGIYYVLISTKAAATEVTYILADSRSRVAVVSSSVEAARDLSSVASTEARLLVLGSPVAALFESWEAQFQSADASLPANPCPGREMLYTSGTTGRPKGVRKPPFQVPFDAVDSRNASVARNSRMSANSVYLSTSPLYHSAPNRYLSTAVHLGATNVILERFEPELALQAIDRYRCTHGLWVPTMFHRLLRLPLEIRGRYRMDSMQVAVHGAAPCPINVKAQMIDWWGPIISEYYSGTEGIGGTSITSQEWLLHPGSVGRANDGIIHILDENDNKLPTGNVGGVYFESDARFEYWNAEEKTNSIRSRQGWRTFGDIGRLDADGYLYLTDRKAFTINRGGVKIYPQEIEDALLLDTRVEDAAVFGLPDEEFGEEVCAVVQLVDPARESRALAEQLKLHCRTTLGPLKTPKRLEFTKQLPRQPTGKLLKSELRQRYLSGQPTRDARI